MEGKSYSVEMIDSGSLDMFVTMLDPIMKTGSAFVIAFSVHDPNGLNIVRDIYNRLMMVKQSRRTPILLVGLLETESSLERVITEEEVEELAFFMNVNYTEIHPTNQAQVEAGLMDLMTTYSQREKILIGKKEKSKKSSVWSKVGRILSRKGKKAMQQSRTASTTFSAYFI